MKLIIGLGNPEKKYDVTRHNIGFEILDAFVADRDGAFKSKDKFRASVAELTIDKKKILIAKPTTYYNLSGETLLLIAEFYKIQPEDILVIHDELALPFGTIRTRVGGSDAGNNGIKSINQRGGKEATRLRIGIATEQRSVVEDTAFVLGKFTADEQGLLQKSILPKILEAIDAFLAGSLETTSHTLVS